MDSFDYKDIIFTEFLWLCFKIPFTGLKVKNRKIDFLACQQIAHVLIELFHIDCFNAFEVIISILVFRCFLPIYEIIIYRNRVWMKPVHSELNG